MRLRGQIQAHNLKVVGSNPTPATKLSQYISYLQSALGALFALRNRPEALRKQEGAKFFILLRKSARG